MRIRIVRQYVCALIVGSCSIGGCASELTVDRPKAPDTRSRQASVCEEADEGIDVDLLFVIDDSHSMREEQASLAREIPKLVKVLTQGGLVVGEEERQVYDAARSIHVGVVSSDMGLKNAAMLPVCEFSGDDGLLRRAEECGAGSGFTSYSPNDLVKDMDSLARSVQCLTQLGTAGCGMEQHLEAMWKALAPASDHSFSGGTSGHGDMENEGFLRENSLLVVVVLADEDDCSFPDKAYDRLFPSGGSRLDLNVRCGNNPDKQHPISRYAEGLRSLRKDAPERFLFAAITGVPLELEGSEYTKILRDPAMQFVAEPADANGMLMPRAVCETDSGVAYPARRLVTLANEFPEQSFVRSICRVDFGTAMAELADAMGKRMQRSQAACD